MLSLGWVGRVRLGRITLVWVVVVVEVLAGMEVLEGFMVQVAVGAARGLTRVCPVGRVGLGRVVWWWW